MYLKGGHFDLAARLAEEMGDLASASLYYLKAGDIQAAAGIEIRLEHPEKAAWFFTRAGQYVKAAEILESIDQLDAAAEQYDRGGYRDKAAILYVRAGKHRLAADLFEKLIEKLEREGRDHHLSESDRIALTKYHRYCGELYLKEGEARRAAPHFEAAHMDDQAAGAWRQANEPEKAANLLLKLQRPEEALKVLQEAGRDIGSLSPAVQAEMLGRQGKHAEAAAILEKAGNLFRAAEAYREGGDLLKAAELFEKEGEIDQAVALYVRGGKQAEAARLYEAARDYRNAADLYRAAGRLDDAARVHLKSDDPVSAARIYYEQKNHDACIKALQKIGPEHPEYRRAAFLLGKIFTEQGLPTLAVDKFTAAIGDEEVNDETVIIYYSLAVAQEANLRPREAMAVYQKIVAFDYAYKDARDRLKAIEETPMARLGTRGGARPTGSSPGAAAAQAAESTEPGRYRIDSSLGAGKLGEVFRGVDTALGRPVAIRRLSEGADEKGKVDRFLKEAAQASQLSHASIVSVYDTAADEHGKFVVSALAQGRTLRALLQEKVRFEVGRIVTIGRQILEALEHAHARGVLHRNLRPENVFVTEDDRVAVADFGMGVRLGDLTTQELSTGRIIQYTPPEVLTKDRVDARSDIYSFGVLIYEMALGRPPFAGTDIGHQQVNAPVPIPGPGDRPLPEFLRRIILLCLEKDKDQRYPDVKAILQDFQVKEIVPGMVVADRYEVLAEVGRGGMGIVFRARDMELDETVALKFLTGDIAPDLVARFIQEIKTARQVAHPNVVRVFTFEKWRDHRFIVMEYIDGAPLRKWLARSPAPARADRLRLAAQIASALEAAHHAGIIHRDIKPDNILVQGTCDARILDFGIARAEAAGHTMTATGTVVGSPMYMSPEQIQALEIDRRSDIYSLGAVLYFLFTGQEPFAGRDLQEILMKHLHQRPAPPHEVDPTLPRPLSEAILRALAPQKEQRFQSAADLAAIFTHALQTAAA
jgi:serine/threonine protein kinase